MADDRRDSLIYEDEDTEIILVEDSWDPNDSEAIFTKPKAISSWDAVSKKEKDSQSRREEKNVPPPGPSDSGWPLGTSGAPPPLNPTPLYQMTFLLTVGSKTQKDDPLNLGLSASRCLLRGTSGQHPHQYKLEMFNYEFEKLVERRRAHESDLGQGRLQWNDEGTDTVIRDQDDFELAVSHLYHRRGASNQMKFSFIPAIFMPEDVGMAAVEQIITKVHPDQAILINARKASERAQERVKIARKPVGSSGRPSDKRIATSNPNSQAPPATSSRGRTDRTTPAPSIGTSSREPSASRTNRTKSANASGSNSRNPSATRTGRTTPVGSSSRNRSEAPAVPEIMTTTMPPEERRRKVAKIRQMFPANEMPKLDAAEWALVKCDGDVEKAFIELGGKPKPAIARKPVTHTNPRPVAAISSISSPLPPMARRPVPNTGAPKPTVVYAGTGSGFNEENGQETLKAASSRISMLNRFRRTSSSKSEKPAISENQKSSFSGSTKSATSSPGGSRKESFSSSRKGSLGETSGTNSPTSTRSGPQSPGLGSRVSSLMRRGTGSSVTSEQETAEEDLSKYNGMFKIRTKVETITGDDDQDELARKLEKRLTLLAGADDSSSDLNSEPDLPKDAATRLQDLQNVEALTQLNLEAEEGAENIWEECCRIFGIDPTETDLENKVPVYGLKNPLFQYQAFAVYWQMVNSRRNGGGFVADTMGLGKTLTFLALIVVERQLCILWDDVEKSRAANDGRHLQMRQLHADVCPSAEERPGWITCPCDLSSPTSRLPKQSGVRIALLPASLMPSWRKQWKEHITPDDPVLDMRLLIAHEDSLASATTQEMANWPVNINALKATKTSRGPDIAKPSQEKFLILATAQSYDALIAKFRYGGPGTKVEALQPNILKTKLAYKAGYYKYNIQFGLGVADESHQDPKAGDGRTGILARLPGNPFIWGYSGTPLESTPRNLEGMLWALEQQAVKADPTLAASGWAQNPYMKQFKHDVFDGICKEYDTLVKVKNWNSEPLMQRFLPFLTTFMIRRTADTQWFGHELVKLKPNVHSDIYFEHNDKYEQEILALQPELDAAKAMALEKLQKMWDSKPANKRAPRRPVLLSWTNYVNMQYKLRILATCPSLIKLTAGENALTLKNDEMRQWRGKEEKNSPYARNIQEIFENSPKLLWLRKHIVDAEPYADVDGKEQKFIIMTHFNCIAHIVKLVIERYVPKKRGRVGLVYERMKTKDRTDMMEAFTGEQTEDRNGNLVRKQGKNYQFLIGTLKQLSAGHHLTRAATVILMEPLLDPREERQAYGRVRRIGQRNPCTFTWRLIDFGSGIEAVVTDRQEKLTDEAVVAEIEETANFAEAAAREEAIRVSEGLSLSSSRGASSRPVSYMGLQRRYIDDEGHYIDDGGEKPPTPKLPQHKMFTPSNPNKRGHPMPHLTSGTAHKWRPEHPAFTGPVPIGAMPPTLDDVPEKDGQSEGAPSPPFHSPAPIEPSQTFAPVLPNPPSVLSGRHSLKRTGAVRRKSGSTITPQVEEEDKFQNFN